MHADIDPRELKKYAGNYVAINRITGEILDSGKDAGRLCDEMQEKYGRTGKWYVTKVSEKPGFFSSLLRKLPYWR